MTRLPEPFLARLSRLVPVHHLDAVVRSFDREKPTTLRVNTLKAETRDVLGRLKQQGFQLQDVPWMRGAFLLRNRRQKDLERTPEYGRGEIYLQGLSGMVPACVLDPRPDEFVLDLAAAPGSKTTQMAALMSQRGRLTAVDDDLPRLERLRANLVRQGVTLAETVRADGASIGRKRPEAYDKVLLDAPCGSEGRFNTKEPRSFRYWKEQRLGKNARLQRRLMSSALQALKVGGLLVYSTCTFAPEENEGVVSWALERFPGALEVQAIAFRLPNTIRGLTEWEGQRYQEGVDRTIRILPTQEMEAFFIARILKRQAVGKGPAPEEGPGA